MKKAIFILTAMLMTASIFTGCANSDKKSAEVEKIAPVEETTNTSIFNTSKEITVISREDGSGTRGAFTELFDIIEKDATGKKIDMTTETADITQSTGVMMTSVSGNDYAIGYISLGSLNDTVKALKIDGAQATSENIKNGSYKISRPFNIVTKGEVNRATQDFINYIMSVDGQTIVEENGYISNNNMGVFTSNNSEGKITIAGSSSVTPVMEKLKEGYEYLNKKVSIEINQSDSTTGMNSVAEGICEIGMASRELKDSEIEKGLKNIVIAIDGIAVVVNNNNTIDELSPAQVKDIYLGNTTIWSQLEK